MLELAHCMFCGADGLRPAFAHRHPWLVQCRRCAFVFSGRRPSAEEIGEYYSKYPVQDRISPITVKRYDEFLHACERFRGTQRLLDYGGGDGFFAERARSRNWQAYVAEVSEAKRRECQAKGLQTIDPAVPCADGGRFDVVVANEVIEHMGEPSALVRLATSCLRPGGLLYLTTPNIEGLSRRMLGAGWRIIEYPEHLNYFSVSTLRRLFAGSSLTIRRVKTTGADLYGLRHRLVPRSGEPGESSPPGESVREALETGSGLRIKMAINSMLSLLRLGDTIKLWAIRQ